MIENPDEIVLENVKMFHLESMNERALWIGCYTQDGKIYHLNISGDQLKYYWSDETGDWDAPIPDGVDPWNLRGRS